MITRIPVYLYTASTVKLIKRTVYFPLLFCLSYSFLKNCCALFEHTKYHQNLKAMIQKKKFRNKTKMMKKKCQRTMYNPKFK